MPRRAKPESRLRAYVALVRAVNLGSRNKVSMPDLRSVFVAVGGEDVKTYVQSGNVVFRSKADEPGKLTNTIEKRLRSELGLDVRVLLRTQAELTSVVAANPFAARQRDPTKLHVTFLRDAVDKARGRKVEATQLEPDEFRILGREVYLHCPEGYGRSKLSNAYFEKELGVAATTRNWRTVTKLAELADAAQAAG
jgi:uncharacterized protein (DUF1697 family)